MKDLKLSLIVQALDRATAPLRRIGAGLQSLEQRSLRLRQAFGRLTFGGLIGGAVFGGTVSAAGAAIFDLTRKTADYGVQALHASQKAAMSVTQIQKLQFAAKMLDVDADSLGETMFRFNQHVQMAAAGSKRETAALAGMGVQIRDAQGKLKPLYDLFLDFSEAFRTMDPGQANFAAFTMLGRGGVRSIPLLEKGRAALLAFGKQAEALGVIMDEKTAQEAEAFQQHMKLVGLSIEGLKMRLGIQLMPAMDGFLQKITAVIAKLQPAIVRKFADSLGKIVEQLPALLNLFSQFLNLIAWAIPTFLDLTNKVGGLKTVFIALGLIMAGNFLASVGSAAGALWAMLKVLRLIKGAALAGMFVSMAEGLAGLIAPIGVATAAMFGLDIAMDANPVGVLVLAIGALLAAIALIAGGVYLIIKNWGGITRFFSGLFDKLLTIFQSGWQRLAGSMPPWLKTLLKIGAVGMAVSVPGMAAPVAAAMDYGHLRPPAHPAAAPPGGHLRPPAHAAAAPPRGRIDIHVHATGGKAKVKTVKVTGFDAAVSRGTFPG